MRELKDTNEGLNDRISLLSSTPEDSKGNFEEITNLIESHSSDVIDLSMRITRLVSRFEAIDGRDKLKKREREVEEMEKRVG